MPGCLVMYQFPWLLLLVTLEVENIISSETKYLIWNKTFCLYYLTLTDNSVHLLTWNFNYSDSPSCTQKCLAKKKVPFFSSLLLILKLCTTSWSWNFTENKCLCYLHWQKKKKKSRIFIIICFLHCRYGVPSISSIFNYFAPIIYSPTNIQIPSSLVNIRTEV